MREVDFYKTRGGKCPVAEFIDSLNSKQAKKVIWVLNLIESMNQIPIEYLKKLSGTENIWEVRIQFASDIFRLLGFMDEGNLKLTNGFVKKSQKTPQREMRKAEQRKADYISRKN
jgi:phage-related protein